MYIFLPFLHIKNKIKKYVLLTIWVYCISFSFAISLIYINNKITFIYLKNILLALYTIEIPDQIISTGYWEKYYFSMSRRNRFKNLKRKTGKVPMCRLFHLCWSSSERKRSLPSDTPYIPSVVTTSQLASNAILAYEYEEKVFFFYLA